VHVGIGGAKSKIIALFGETTSLMRAAFFDAMVNSIDAPILRMISDGYICFRRLHE
jgi:hypothetical protein